MPWPLRFLGTIGVDWQLGWKKEGCYFPQAGDCWWDPNLLDYAKHRLSQKYFTQWADKRPPLTVAMPGGSWWTIDDLPTCPGDGWDISLELGPHGEPLHVTASPSINVIGKYHGWLRDSVLTDDCEGRTFPPPTP
ncbi:MAG: hypothetical protein M1274_06950 [Actinobacteria bacterium]|nr:hypothetical protein [Actinomycetota bacterium]